MSKEEMNEFEKVMEPAVRWFNEHCNPNQRIIIEAGNVEILGGQMGFPFEIPD